ncbi:uncharacterized protein inaF-D isoform X2 [Diabrotica undecimpunctata]|uniref:uncharacterized protein inaF-D isoform X2 n=1 Tax=Diabrotica undecimpunctata TaxID=50387 RepID=UPI003B6398E3
MSYKATNGIKLTMSGDSAQWKTASLLDTTVKFAGDEAKDRLYEPKHKKKIVRVLTVVAYVFFVSLAAIMLSLYYVFLWNGDQKMTAKYVTSESRQQINYAQNCKSIVVDLQQQFPAVEPEMRLPSPTTTSEDNTTNWQEDYNDSLEDLRKTSKLIKKLWDRDEENY